MRTDEDPLVSPSDLGGAKALPGDLLSGNEEAAKARGTLLHLLLERLPSLAESERPDAAERIIRACPEARLLDTTEGIADEALSIIANPDLAWVFADDTFAEVDIAAPVHALDERRMLGTIDRLIVREDLIHVIDFKSNQAVPETVDTVPEGLLRQMGAYCAGLSEIYPEREIQPYILWTRTAQLMELPREIVMQALLRTPIS